MATIIGVTALPLTKEQQQQLLVLADMILKNIDEE